MTFRLYSDAGCATEIFTSANRPVTPTSATTGTATSATFAPANTGQYFWRAFFSGDANNLAVSGACGAAGETSTVAPAQPAIATLATNATVGQPIGDTATVSALSNPIAGAGAGTVEFRLYSDAACANQIFVSSNRTLTLNSATSGTATSATFAPANTGQYFWRAFFSGDTNNLAVSGACGAAGETSTVAPAQPAIATLATNAPIGGSVSDTASLTRALVNPVAGAGAGTVEFRLYSDNLCANQIFVSSNRPLNLTSATTGTSTSETVAPPNAGQYFWRAFYSGDTNNLPVSGACGAAGEYEHARLRRSRRSPPPRTTPRSVSRSAIRRPSRTWSTRWRVRVPGR